MYEPVFRVTEMANTKSVIVEIGDCIDPSNGYFDAHFTILIMPSSATIVIQNNHTNEKVEYKGQSDVSRLYGTSQYAYDVFYKKGRRMEKKKIGVVLTKSWKEDYKDFLTKPLLRAVMELERKYGENWLIFY